MAEKVYIQMKGTLELAKPRTIYLQDIAEVSTNTALQKSIEKEKIYQITSKDESVIVLDRFIIVKYLNKTYDFLNIKPLGESKTIIRIISKEKNKFSILYALAIWLLLFIGAAMTIMNFHYDVNMQEVQEKLHFIITGEKNNRPLWLQIPYSIGLSVGMLLFLNPRFKKRLSKEPSPLEIELFNYQKNVDQYIKEDRRLMKNS